MLSVRKCIDSLNKNQCSLFQLMVYSNGWPWLKAGYKSGQNSSSKLVILRFNEMQFKLFQSKSIVS